MDAFQSFSKILSFARDLNAQLQVPEIVFVGSQGHGKSSLIEAFVGFPLFPVGSGGCTKRPVILNLINNPSCDTPKITVKKETSRLSNVHGADKVLDLEAVEKETTGRNELVPEALVINYESKTCWNLTLIDTPGLANSSEKSTSQGPGPKEIEDLVLSIAKPTNRFLVFVEELKEGSQSEMVVLAKKIDPKFDRTAFVFTKFSEQLKTFGTSRDLNRFLSGAAPDTHTPVYFVSLVPAALRSGLAAKEKYNKKLADLVNDDLNTLEQLQYDRRYHSQVGFLNFKKYLLEFTWNKYQVAIPELLKRLRAFKKKNEEDIVKLEHQETALTGSVLRGNASRYAVHFLHCIEKLIEGTLEGNPQINGQSLSEEKSQDETGDWINWEFDIVKVDAHAWKIGHADSKLYGGQQFERLLAEFRALVEHLPMEALTMDEIATALGPQKLTSSSSLLWAASDIAQRQVRRALVPLLDQLFKRAKYIMKRLVHIVADMIQVSIKNKKRVSGPQQGAKGKEAANDSLLEEMSKSPFFVHYLNDLFEKFVDKVADDCKNKCKDEFYSTRLIFWESANIDKKQVSIAASSSPDEIEKAVNTLAKEIFTKTRQRISQNILLKSYNFFLVPMGSELWAEIQGHITCLNDAQLNELFEVEQTGSKLKGAKQDLTQVLSRFDVKEEEFVSISNGFSKVSPRDIDF